MRDAVVQVMAEEPEDQLVSDAQDGSPGAFSELTERHYRDLLRLLSSYDYELAQDATQESFLRAWQQIGQLNDQGAFRGWLYRIGRNTLADLQRRRMRRRQRFIPIARLKEPTGYPSWIAGRPALEDPLLDNQIVQHVLAGLRRRDREILLLRHVAGFSVREIATAQAVTEEAARRRINRAEQRFREHYLEYAGGNEAEQRAAAL